MRKVGKEKKCRVTNGKPPKSQQNFDDFID